MIREKPIEHHVQRSGNNAEFETAALELMNGVVCTFDQFEFGNRIVDIVAGRARGHPPLHIQFDPLIVTDLAALEHLEAFLVDQPIPDVPVIQHFPDHQTIRVFDKRSVHIETDQVERPLRHRLCPDTGPLLSGGAVEQIPEKEKGPERNELSGTSHPRVAESFG